MSIQRIRTGQYLGECLVDCNQEIDLTPEHLVYRLTGNVPDPSYPDIEVSEPLDPKVWEEISQAADLDAFARLPRTIGRPDASDAGGEYVEVSDGGGPRRVDFELGAPVPEIGPLLDRLRQSRAEAAERHRR